jgi:hypothetical protein
MFKFLQNRYRYSVLSKRRPSFIEWASMGNLIHKVHVSDLWGMRDQIDIDELQRAASIVLRTGKPHYMDRGGWVLQILPFS